jgi:C4-dicarboxylate-specific signal transduction histidine kinase
VQRVTTAGEMTAEIAHQINQPLAAIVNFAAGLATRLRDGKVQPDAMREVAERIAAEARRAGEVISRLRAFLRKGESTLRDCDLNLVVTRVYGLLEDDFRRETVDAHLLLDRRLPMLQLDAILIEQVLLNLLRNALEALTPLRADARRLDVATSLADARACVTVTDSGIGLPPGGEGNIFEAFYTTKPEGLGLGLSVSRSIIKAVGGQLWAESNPGGGATVGFSLPLASAARI